MVTLPYNKENMIIYMHHHVLADSWFTYVHILSFWPQRNVWPSAHFYYQNHDVNVKISMSNP